ncbi:mechanosensitive ion channel protein 1, mitochondrial-like [Typha angustifolia]|uniref:mechanosensitive ion channel protein 1, mitochondrial-like n=1 Tax=Typha angustifolia TaxID=59011 RepID=UPI003C2AB4B5
MLEVRAILHKSYAAVTNPCFRTRHVQSYGSSITSSRFRSNHLSTTPGILAANRLMAVDWHPRYQGKGNNIMLGLSSLLEDQGCQTDSYARFSQKSSDSSWFLKSMPHSRCIPFSASLSMMTCSRAYSSHVGGKPDGAQHAVSNNVPAEVSSAKTADAVGNDWVDMLDHVRRSAVDTVTTAGQKSKELSDSVMPYIQQLYDSYPYLEKVIVPVGGTLFGTILAWFVMPRIFRKLHKYASESPLTVLLGSSSKEQVPYQYSMWSALEDPARYLITFLAFSQLGLIIAPSTSEYLPQAWRGAIVLSFVWFLHRWKTNFFTSVMFNKVTVGLDQDKLSALEKVSSLGLIVLGVMALAEACGVAVQSILTVGGIGGVATAFAARDILGNMLSGFSLQLSKPFSVGDNIKAGSIEGQVVEIGLTTTSLINPEKFPVIVPNSLFSSQVIVNKSRAQWRASVTKIPVRIEDIEKIPLVSEAIKSMLRSTPQVFLEKDAPYCYLSRLENSFGELTIGCNLKNMRKDELFAAEQDIILKAARIIRQHGAELGSTLQCC